MTPTDLFKLTKIATIKKELLHVKEDADSFLSFLTDTGTDYDVEYAIMVVRTISSLLDNTKAWYERSLDGQKLTTQETQAMSMDDLFYNKIDFFCNEKEANVIVITPEGTRLMSTNDPVAFTYIRLVIKKNKLKGYKVVTDDGEIHDILSNGKVRDYPEGKLPGDVYGKILQELI